MLGHVRKQLADRDAALAVLLEFPRAAERVAVVVELRRLDLHLERLAVLRGQPRLGIERVDLRRPAIHVEEDHALRLGGEMGGSWRQRAGGRRCRFGRRQQIPAIGVGQQGRQRQCAKTIGRAHEHLAPRESEVSNSATRKIHAIALASRAPPVCAETSVDKNKFLRVQQHVSQVGPDPLVVLPGVGRQIPKLRLLEQKISGGAPLGSSARGQKRPDTSGRSVRSPTNRARPDVAQPTVGLLRHNGSFIRINAWAGTFDTFRRPDGRRRNRHVKGQHHRRKKIAPHRQINAAPSVAVERARLPAGRALACTAVIKIGTLGPNSCRFSRPDTARIASRMASPSSRRSAHRCSHSSCGSCCSKASGRLDI